MSNGSLPNRVRFPRKQLSGVQQRIRERLRERKINQGLAVSDDEDPEVEVELAEGKKSLSETILSGFCTVTNASYHRRHCHLLGCQ